MRGSGDRCGGLRLADPSLVDHGDQRECQAMVTPLAVRRFRCQRFDHRVAGGVPQPDHGVPPIKPDATTAVPEQ